jgi:hypothetical protein
VLLPDDQGGRVRGGHVAAAQSDVQDVDDVERLLPERCPRHHLVADDGGVVHQDVEPALLALDLLEQGFRLLVIGMIHPDGDALAARCRDQVRGFADGAAKRRLAGLLGSPGDVHGAAVAAERVRDPEPGTAAGARDDGDRSVGAGHQPRSFHSARCGRSTPSVVSSPWPG